MWFDDDDNRDTMRRRQGGLCAMKRTVILVALLVASSLMGCSTTSGESTGSTADVPEPTGEPYRMEINAPAKTQVGVEATTEVIVTPGSGYKINVDYPVKLQIQTVPEGTKVAAQTVTKEQMQVEKTRLFVPVRFTADAPGEKRFEGELRFSVCTPQFCKMPSEHVSWTTVAEAAGQ
jgi:hypothetical protein